MSARTARAVVWAAAVAAPGAGWGNCELAGTVTDDAAPIGNASVVIERDGAAVADTLTLADGSYSLAYPAFTGRLNSATVRVEAPGFTQDERIIARRGRCLETATNDVELAGADGAPDGASALGTTIFVAPYTLSGPDAAALEAQFNAQLPDIVHSKILAYQSGLDDLPLMALDIGVDVLNERLTPREAERIRRVGHQLNAMGVVAGIGAPAGGTATGPTEIEITSVYRIIPTYRNLGFATLPIFDRVPVDEVSPGRVAQGLHDTWGKQALLSLVIARLAARDGRLAAGEADQLRGLLSSVQATMAPDDRLLGLVEALRDVLDEEGGP